MKTFKIKGGSTWNNIMNNTKITDIQDPLMEMELPKADFGDMYKEIVCELQGNDECYESYANYYFTNNPTKSFVLSFRGEKDSNSELKDFAQKLEQTCMAKTGRHSDQVDRCQSIQ